MQLGYIIIYVPDVAKAVAFYATAFGLAEKFIHESGHYAEMETGSTTLSFAAEAMAEGNGVTIRPNTPGDPPAAFEVTFVTDDPDAAYAQAMTAGAVPVKPVEAKPWGQRVAYVRDLNGCLVEICSPVGH